MPINHANVLMNWTNLAIIACRFFFLGSPNYPKTSSIYTHSSCQINTRQTVFRERKEKKAQTIVEKLLPNVLSGVLAFAGLLCSIVCVSISTKRFIYLRASVFVVSVKLIEKFHIISCAGWLQRLISFKINHSARHLRCACVSSWHCHNLPTQYIFREQIICTAPN